MLSLFCHVDLKLKHLGETTSKGFENRGYQTSFCMPLALDGYKAQFGISILCFNNFGCLGNGLLINLARLPNSFSGLTAISTFIFHLYVRKTIKLPFITSIATSHVKNF
jgi:hypothetical protein